MVSAHCDLERLQCSKHNETWHKSSHQYSEEAILELQKESVSGVNFVFIVQTGARVASGRHGIVPSRIERGHDIARTTINGEQIRRSSFDEDTNVLLRSIDFACAVRVSSRQRAAMATAARRADGIPRTPRRIPRDERNVCILCSVQKCFSRIGTAGAVEPLKKYAFTNRNS
jgi:hypothetical protein